MLLLILQKQMKVKYIFTSLKKNCDFFQVVYLIICISVWFILLKQYGIEN
jgi:hypothetical protein